MVKETKNSPMHRLIASISILCIIAGLLASVTVVTAQAGKLPASKVTIYADGCEWEYVTCKRNVKEVLQEAGIKLGINDRAIPTLATKIKQGLKIKVVRITEEIITSTETIPYKTKTKFDNHGTSPTKTVVTKGVNGERLVKTKVVYKDGVKAHTKVISSSILKSPVTEVISISKNAFLASRKGSKIPSLRMSATAYDPGPKSCGPNATGRTAMGLKAGKGIAAVDPKVIPLGTKLYVEGYGFCVAGDTGSAIKGNKIDLCFDTYREAVKFGRKKVTVYIIK